MEVNQTEYPFLTNAYKHSKKLHTDNRSSWYDSLNISLENIQELKRCQKNLEKVSKRTIHKILKGIYIKLCHDNLQGFKYGKLRTYMYVKIKQQYIYSFENYLDIINNFESRRCLIYANAFKFCLFVVNI